ncbi:DUF805 domain-containing protein [Spartinivicinus ruber]|uniref:DUF805 domain-containing protein n=1 Tax=Spartinivicinus ruber TaxID=2683272 RepID=UPI0013D459DC|nr:DUF805 domain-containing protein [Spartinivicinus ruber]
MSFNPQPVKSQAVTQEASRYPPARWLFLCGRLGRVRFTCYVLAVVLPIIIVLDILRLLAKTRQPDLIDVIPAVTPWIVVSVAATILLPLIIRRLHDFGWSAWYCAGLLIPFANLLVLIHLFIGAGQQQPNRYGPAPKPNTPIIWVLFGFLMGVPFLYFYKIFKTYLLFLLIAIY